MDPFTIATTCVGLIGTIAQLSAQIKDFVGRFRDTRKDLESVTAELQSLSMCLECLQNDYSNGRISYPENISKTLLAVLQNCTAVTDQMETLLRETSSASVAKRLHWATHGRQRMQELRSSLEAHKSAIDIALEMTTAVVVSSVADTTYTISDRTKEIQQDTAKIGIVLDEIQNLRVQLLCNDQRNSENLILDRFLDETCTYAESVFNPTDIDEADQIGATANFAEEKSRTFFRGDLLDIYALITPGCTEKVPLAEWKIFNASRRRATMKEVARPACDRQLARYLLTPQEDPKRHVERLERLLDEGADVNAVTEMELPQVRLHWHRQQPMQLPMLGAELCTNKSVAAVALLISRGADVTSRGLLHLAAKASDHPNPILELMLRQGADPNILPPEGWPSAYQGCVLTISCRDFFNLPALRMLLEAGAKPNQVSYKGETPLFTAVWNGFSEYTDILLAHGASVFVSAAPLGGILQYAVAGLRPSLYCIEELLRRGCAIDEVGGAYGTALSAAVAQGRPEVVKLLLASGADPNPDVPQGKRPLDWLEERRRGEYTRKWPPLRKVLQSELDEIEPLLIKAGALRSP